jgi:hypothetical protein
MPWQRGERAILGFSWVFAATAMIFVVVTLCNALRPEPIEAIEVGDGGFLSGDPCGPPCLWGIVPGQTREAQAIEILREYDIFQSCKPLDSEAEGGSRGLNCGDRIFLGFATGTDLVDGIGLDPTGLTVGDAIYRYGEPDAVLHFPAGTVEFPDMMLVIVYREMLTELRLPEQEGLVYLLESTTPIWNIAYFASMEDPTANIFYEEWKGYGEC